MRDFAKALTKMDNTAKSPQNWAAIMDAMTESQRNHFTEATASLVEAAIYSTVRYQETILRKIYSTARSRPNVKFGATERRIGVPIVERVMPPTMAA